MKRILVVDDDTDIRVSMGMSIEFIGYECILAEDARTAREAHERQPADLIILDYMMPEIDGGKFCQALRNSGDRTPVIMLSADRDIVCKSQNSGADLVMKKPFDVCELVEAIEQLTGSEASERSPEDVQSPPASRR